MNELEVISNLLQEQLSSKSFSLDNDGVFRRWNKSMDVCCIVELYSPRRGAVDMTLAFVSQVIREHFLFSRPEPPTVNDAPYMRFNAASIVRANKPKYWIAWPIGQSVDKATHSELSFIIENNYVPMISMLGSLTGWPDFLESRISQFPAISGPLYSILIYVLIELRCPVDRVLDAWIKHNACAGSKLQFHLDKSRQMIKTIHGIDVF